MFIPPPSAPNGLTNLELRRTEVGRAAEEIVASGDLLPDELMLKVVSSKLDALRSKVCSTRFLQNRVTRTILILLSLLSIGYWMASLAR
jgi:adenylate kinase family enzyme